jgi:hypothetical protein
MKITSAEFCENALEGLASRTLNLSMLIERRARAQERRVVPETIARFITESAPSLNCEGIFRLPFPRCATDARTGSIRVARHAGKKHAASATIVMTTKADPNASGSRGLTLYSRLPISRVSSSAATAPITRFY